MNKFKKTIAAFAIALAFVGVAATSAKADTISDLLAQIAALTAQINALKGGSTVSASVSFTRSLTIGSSGSDVTALQTWLIAKGYSIPAGATGYFGAQTKAAVAAYQAANGITPAAGYFGPITIAKVNASNSVTVGGTTTGGTTTGTPTGITTPGVEGILTVTAGPISSTVVNVGQTMVPVLTIRNQAQNSDIDVQRVTLDLGTDTTLYNKIFDKIYVTDGTNVLATVDLNSSNVVQSGSTYVTNITGFHFIVPKNTYRDLVIKADLFPSIDSTYRSGAKTITVDANGVRGTDGAGIDQYGPASGTISQSLTINASLVDNSIANVSLDPSTPQAASVPVTDTTNGQYLKLPILTFSLGAQNDAIHIHNLAVNITANGTGSVSAAYLYQGSTQISSAAVSNGVATFSNITDGTAGATVAVNTTLPYTIKVDVTGVTSGSLAITASTTATGTTLYNSQDSSANSVNGISSTAGNTVTVLGKGPAFSLASAPTISVSGSNSSGSTVSTSTITATFNVNAQAVGTNVYFGTQASTSHPMFTFKVFNGAGTDVTANLVSTSSGFIVPTGQGFVTTNVGTNSFYLPQQQSGTLSNVTFSFAGKSAAGVPLTAGPYSVEIASINYSNDNGATYTSQSYMDGQSAWRTNGVNP